MKSCFIQVDALKLLFRPQLLLGSKLHVTHAPLQGRIDECEYTFRKALQSRYKKVQK